MTSGTTGILGTWTMDMVGLKYWFQIEILEYACKSRNSTVKNKHDKLQYYRHHVPSAYVYH